MTSGAPTDITLTRQGTTLIYLDTSIKTSAWVYWLAVPPSQPPATLTLDEAWTPNRGFVLFIDKTPPDWATFETALAAALDPKPVHTGFGWIKTARIAGDWVVTVSADATVVADTSIAPRGLPCLDIKADTPVALDATAGGAVIALSHPPIPAHGSQPPADPPSGPGVSIDLTGPGAGAARFELLQAFPDDDPGDDAAIVKPIFAAVFDPLRPTRTTFSYTGVDISLREVDGVFSIAAT
jgi:hypothetical protein